MYKIYIQCTKGIRFFINVVITAMIIMMFCIGIEPVTQQMQNRHYERRATHHACTMHPEAVIDSLLGF